MSTTAVIDWGTDHHTPGLTPAGSPLLLSRVHCGLDPPGGPGRSSVDPVRSSVVRGDPVRSSVVRGDPVRSSVVRGDPVRSSVVRGDYLYYHYGCDGLDDRGWGCGYRTVQTLASWLAFNRGPGLPGRAGFPTQSGNPDPDWVGNLTQSGNPDPDPLPKPDWVGNQAQSGNPDPKPDWVGNQAQSGNPDPKPDCVGNQAQSGNPDPFPKPDWVGNLTQSGNPDTDPLLKPDWVGNPAQSGNPDPKPDWVLNPAQSGIPVPSLPDIQRALVLMGDKEASFRGSRGWIGAVEASLVLDFFYDVPCRVVHVRGGGAELEAVAVPELHRHFETRGSPVMMGGDRDNSSKGILGVCSGGGAGGSSVLVVDPHYYGTPPGRSALQTQGWVRWVRTSSLDQSSFYNLCLPLNGPAAH